MRIERVEIRKIFLDYVSPFETSGWREDGSYALIVRVEADDAVGWGETPVGAHPFYNEENVNTCWIIQRDYLIPMLMGAEINEPADVPPAVPPGALDVRALGGVGVLGAGDSLGVERRGGVGVRGSVVAPLARGARDDEPRGSVRPVPPAPPAGAAAPDPPASGVDGASPGS